MLTTIFVYGSLKRGFHNHRALASSTFIADAVSADRFQMWGWGYPYLAADANGRPVAGELFEVDEATLPRLDRLEGHPHHYRREQRDFLVADDVRRAWIYLVAGRWPSDEDSDEGIDLSDDGVLRWVGFGQ